MAKNIIKPIFSLGFIFASAVQPVLAKDNLIAHNVVKKTVTAIYYPTNCRRVKTVRTKSGEILSKVATEDVKCPQTKTPHFIKKGTFSNHSGSASHHSHDHKHSHNSSSKASNKIDNNSCKEGSLIGGLLGAGVTMSATRGKDRWWAVPAGGAAGAMIGCQIDGG